MKKWIRKFLGIDFLVDLIIKNNTDTQNQLREIQKQQNDTQNQLVNIQKQQSETQEILIDTKNYLIDSLSKLSGISMQLDDMQNHLNDIQKFQNDTHTFICETQKQLTDIQKKQIDYHNQLYNTENHIIEIQNQLSFIDEKIHSAPSSASLPTLTEEIGDVISEFEISNELATISFKSIELYELKENLPKIYLDKENQNSILGTISNIVGGSANTGLAALATKGLFKATADPSTLMKLASGGFSSAVREGGKITKHAGFVQASMTMLTPMAIFSIMSIATGQYFMKTITKQLTDVQEKLDELISLHHIERQAILIKSYQFLTEYLNKKYFASEDFVMLKNIISDLTGVREEYYLMIEESVSEIQQSSQYFNMRSKKEAKTKSDIFKKSGFIFKMRTSLIADELFHLAKLTEFHMNLCYKNPDANRVNLIGDQLKSMSNFNSDNISFKKTQTLYINMKNDIDFSLNETMSRSWWHEAEVVEIKTDLVKTLNDFERERNEKLESIASTYRNVIEPFKKEREIVIDTRSGNAELYMEQ